MLFDDLANLADRFAKVLTRIASDRSFRRKFLTLYGGVLLTAAIVVPLGILISRGGESSQLFLASTTAMAGASVLVAVRWMATYLNAPQKSDNRRYKKTGRIYDDDAIAILFNVIDELRADFKSTQVGQSTTTPELQDKILESWKRKIESVAVESIAEKIESAYAEKTERWLSLKRLDREFYLSRDRLSQEVNALSRRGNLNLIIGVVATFLAIGVLIYIALSTKVENSPWPEMIPSLSLRLSVVIFTEIFAFFFLRLYRNALQEIKHFQNEITNLEAKHLALKAALLRDDQTAVRAVIAKLASTERNFILKRGETVIELEHARISSGASTQLIKDLSAAIARSAK